MSELWACADHHFFHKNIIKFADADGKRYRPFDTLDSMHEHIVVKHNSVVSKNDTVYFLGDVTFNPRGLELLNEMNGNKVLLQGNHDTLQSRVYLKYFTEIHGGFKKYDMFLSHVPVHPAMLDRWKLNVHGHLHADRVMLLDIPDDRYYNVSLEAIDFTPVNFDVLKEFVETKRGK